MISSIAAEAFPSESNSKRAHVIYIKNILKMIGYAPELKLDMLGLITERLVKIDVQVQVDLEDLADDIGEGLIQEIPHFAEKTMEDLHESDIDDDPDTDNDEDPEAQRTKEIVKNVEKMDHMLDILFSYYDQVFLVEPAANWSGVLDILLSQFTTIILPTYRSRHTQFLLFHFVQQSPNFIDTFVGMCAQISFDQHRPAIVRQAAASYLASFVARGVHVPSDIVRDVWDYISNELTRLRQNYEPSCRGPDLGRYSTYYALVQALLYIFCFRWRDLEARSDDDCDDGDMPGIYNEEHQWRSGVKETLNLNLFSPQLNPLKVCSPAIVAEFARIAHHLGIIYVGHRLESNRRLRLSQFSGPRGYGGMLRETALNSRKDEEHYQLEEYFPFDPYHLPRSKRWINSDYREWTSIPGLEDGEASQSESEVEAAETNFEEATETDGTDES